MKEGCFSGMVGSICRLMTGVVLVIGDVFGAALEERFQWLCK